VKNRSILGGLLALGFAASHAAMPAWEPPPGATGQQVLHEARKDAEEGRFAAAAEKHLWFHEHVLEREPAMSGVRVSFALSDWAMLARRHAPAMAQLLAVRDRAFAQIDDGGWAGQRALSEVIHINHYLGGQRESTRDAFARFARRDPVLAERELMDALPALIQLNEFDLASRHLRVPTAVGRVESVYQTLQQAALSRLSDGERAALLRSQQRVVDVQLARVVLVLSKQGRDAEAEQVLARGRALLGPEASVHHMTEALRGIAPPDDEPA
jgi:hypothetical protein